MAGSMQQLWSLMESLQIVQHMGLYDVKTPGNVNAFSGFFTTITSMELIDTEMLFDDFWYWPS